MGVLDVVRLFSDFVHLPFVFILAPWDSKSLSLKSQKADWANVILIYSLLGLMVSG